MSHLSQRKEKNCLNCGTTVIGRYCHVCGQENIEPRESAWHFVVHFFNDITHFDGKFFTTLRDLLFRPGYLSREYMEGRRASYLNPIRMYLFTSFIFFLVVFSIVHMSDTDLSRQFTFMGKTVKQVENLPQKDFDRITSTLNHGKPMTREEYKLYNDSLLNNKGEGFFQTKYKDVAEFDSLMKLGVVKEGRLNQIWIRKKLKLYAEYGPSGEGKFMAALINGFIHKFPQMLFVSLPFIALFLKLLYIRRKKFYYVGHAIFSIHFYIFVFIAMLLSIGVSELKEALNWNGMKYLNGVITLMVFFYLYKAMRNFYQQGRGKTILKYLLFLSLFFLLMLSIFVFFLAFSFFQL